MTNAQHALTRTSWLRSSTYIWISFFSLLVTIFLSSCTHMTKHDGPPNYYIDASKVPDAVPRSERLSRYGNLKSYRVFGHRYYPMRRSRHYQQTGIASW